MFLYLSVACIQVWYSNNFCICVTPHQYISFLCLLILILNSILVKLVLSFLSSFFSTYSSSASFISQLIKQLKCIFKSKHHRRNFAPNMCINLSPSLFIIKVFSALVFLLFSWTKLTLIPFPDFLIKKYYNIFHSSGDNFPFLPHHSQYPIWLF